MFVDKMSSQWTQSRGEVIISQHNIIADMLAALGSDRHLLGIHTHSSGEQQEHNVPHHAQVAESRLRGLMLGVIIN